MFISLLSFVLATVFAHTTTKQEPLYGFSILENSVEIIVKSNGCTKQQDFRLEELDAGEHTLLNIVRIKADRCRAMSRAMAITLPLKSKSIVYYKINNSFVDSNIFKKIKDERI